ncbi:glutathione synthase [Leptolyngbya boryana NIES-2135]|jgi:cyanophycin synthetase|uniref:Glutathione synthase n=1 Tax=Leptolyngbya boryana NIES-2135 TaxID=1973484 RepID=A0A1Z4JAJ7_LEPBY|nr:MULTISPECIES: acetate--CoA ligase family protein [Leptolyngbya]BAY53740.1 glutathione synthase [Leptolyngbya boryana NIES-2135]MBD2367818.1 acetate--CoA ligase family protein [Leptolyngbya sp. FACHB-161]MBD2374334.1 acetate--CoA ligase family protein [Leptolyngbya sp. FACHB-238]MBD2398556.1 acetate--CoA ligase family protein [Leptolyngbya sp. FACHB-239]MBD2406258.1 acetate--CoA ligase family protein [Leptolyngbya sp. FACHB-402]
MVVDRISELNRVNARKTDAFDIFNIRAYVGANPYLSMAAIVFDFTLTKNQNALPVEQYAKIVSDRYPDFREKTFTSHADLFAQTVAKVSALEMDLHLQHWSVTAYPQFDRIAVETLHARTSRELIFSVWDWFEAMTQGQDFAIADHIEVLQAQFRRSVYGGPTVYALLKSARELGIPTFYLWDEGLMQYGYGRKQVRGIATTFERDSHLDSDFTTRKDDCKAFLQTLGFPVPKGRIVSSFNEALNAVDRIGYPVAVKPVVGHKGIGVTANIQSDEDLEAAFDRAVEAVEPEQSIRIIIEQSIEGDDFRLLCVDGKFIAATKREPASVVGDGMSTIEELINRANRSPERSDTPTSPMGKIHVDDAMHRYLAEQDLSIETVLERDRTIFLRKVANLSAGGLSIDATPNIHPDNIVLAQDVAQHFRLTCLGIDIMTRDLSRSWKEGNFAIIEINAAPGIFMHLKPAIGNRVDVTSHILKTFFHSSAEARIPIITFNRVTLSDLQTAIAYILRHYPHWTIGAACQDGILINHSEKPLHPDYNTNIQNLLRNPKLDLLITEYPESILDRSGMFYEKSNLVVLNDPTEIEMMLAKNIFEDAKVVIKQGSKVSTQYQGLIEQYALSESFDQVYLEAIAAMIL